MTDIRLIDSTKGLKILHIAKMNGGTTEDITNGRRLQLDTSTTGVMKTRLGHVIHQYYPLMAGRSQEPLWHGIVLDGLPQAKTIDLPRLGDHPTLQRATACQTGKYSNKRNDFGIMIKI
jgi:hypothetical protein